MSTVKPLALVCSVELEAEPVRAVLQAIESRAYGGKPAWRGDLDGHPALVLTAGMGKTNAAHALTALIEREDVRGVIGFGIGGAYVGSGLGVGDIAIATQEVYGDEGVETPTGWISTEGIGIPLLPRSGAPCFNHFPLDSGWAAATAAALRRAGFHALAGPFVTVSTCSGTTERGSQLATRFDAICETMEGAAYAHVAAIYDLPYIEVRGISNLVTDRDLGGWRLRDAAEAAAHAVRFASREI
ncbi:futalosine hydrolase [soil metagenome]